MEFLPIIEKEKFEGQSDKDWDFIYTILDPYQHAIDEVEDENVILDQLCDDQHTLLIYDALYGQVTNGGFLPYSRLPSANARSRRLLAVRNMTRRVRMTTI